MPCRWCKLPKTEHRSGLVDHQYQEEGTTARPELAIRSGAGADLVLRQALIDRGIIRLHDIIKAEKKIRTMSQEAVPDGQDR